MNHSSCLLRHGAASIALFSLLFVHPVPAAAQCPAPAGTVIEFNAVKNGEGFNINFRGSVRNFLPDNFLVVQVVQGTGASQRIVTATGLAVLSADRTTVNGRFYVNRGLWPSDKFFFRMNGDSPCTAGKQTILFSGTRVGPIAVP